MSGCAECGKEEGGGIASLKMCKACMLIKYCSASCQKNHWPTHKKVCKRRAAELHDEALFKDPPAKEDCPICFLPMPKCLLACISLPPATISSVPIYDFSIANEGLAKMAAQKYYCCCGKSICRGCLYSFHKSGNIDYCPHCRADKRSKTDEERVKELKKRVEVNDSGAMYILGNSYGRGYLGLRQDHAKGIELLAKAAGLGSSEAHFELGAHFDEAGDSKKERFHYEAAAMAGHENARVNLGLMELQSGNTERAVKHWMIAASAGSFRAMHNLRTAFKDGLVSRDTIESTLTAYNNSCVEMRSKARDAAIQLEVDTSYTINIT